MERSQRHPLHWLRNMLHSPGPSEGAQRVCALVSVPAPLKNFIVMSVFSRPMEGPLASESEQVVSQIAIRYSIAAGIADSKSMRSTDRSTARPRLDLGLVITYNAAITMV